MKYKQLVEEVRDRYRLFDKYLVEQGMEPMTAHYRNGIEVIGTPLSLAVYPSSPKGETYRDEGNLGVSYFTLELYVNDVASAESLDILEDYYSALMDFTHSLEIEGYPVTIDTSLLARTDDGAPLNEVLILIAINSALLSDYGWQ